MNICLLSYDYLPNIGGIAAHVDNLSKSLQKLGHEISIITIRRIFFEEKYQNFSGIKIVRIYIPNLKSKFITGLFLLLVYPFIVQLNIFYFNRKNKINIIHAHTIYDAFATTGIKGIPIVYTEHSSNFLEAVEKRNLASYFYKFNLKKSDFLIGPSIELINNFIKMGVDERKTKFIPNGVDTEKYYPKEKSPIILKKFSLSLEDNILLCPRRLVPKNGVIYFIYSISDIIKNYPKIQCLIIGNGSEKEKLMHEVKKRHLENNIIFVGAVPNDQMIEYYSISDIVILPSLKEATSIAGLEAMACGKPIIGTDVGGIPFILKNDYNGIIVKPKDSKALSDAIFDILSNPLKKEIFGSNSKKIVDKYFRWDVIVKDVVNIYQLFWN